VGAYELVIFDLDGTLIDSVGDIADALNRVLGTSYGDAQVARWVGSGVRELLRRAGAQGDLDEIAERYREAYTARPLERTSAYLGVKETLARLPADKAVATNKPGALARTIVKGLGLDGQLPVVLGEDDVGARKPDPLIVDVLRGRFGVTRARTLYVGDSRVDAQTAEAARVDLCLVTYGYEDAAVVRATPAKFHIDRFVELQAIAG
jgi:phosphoglycolate phosphatase